MPPDSISVSRKTEDLLRRRLNVDVDVEELGRVIDTAENGPLSKADRQKLKTTLQARVERLAQKRNTEKTNSVLEQRDSSSPTTESRCQPFWLAAGATQPVLLLARKGCAAIAAKWKSKRRSTPKARSRTTSTRSTASKLSPQFLSHATEQLQQQITDWQSRPLERVYPVVFVDGLRVAVRTAKGVLKQCIIMVGREIARVATSIPPFREPWGLPQSESHVLRLLAERIKTPRIPKTWSQEQLAERSSIQRSYLANLERGRRNPSVRTLLAITNALGVSLGALFAVRVEIK